MGVHIQSCLGGTLRCFSAVVGLAIVLDLVSSTPSAAQTTVLHLHAETSGAFLQLRTDGPDVASATFQSANLRGLSGEHVIREFVTAAGAVGDGAIGGSQTVSIQLWMRKTDALGTHRPRVRFRKNDATGQTFCTANGSTALTTILTKYTLTCSTSLVSFTSTDAVHVWVGVNTSGTVSNTADFHSELAVEGTLNGNHDSQVSLPSPRPYPSITALSPDTGLRGGTVVLSGTDFGAMQGTSIVRFSGTTSTVTSWSDTSITAVHPTSIATSGDFVVTVAGLASNAARYVVLPNPVINALAPTSAGVGTSVNVVGNNFGSTQGSSTVSFNGVPATPTHWGSSLIQATVPAGATTGDVVVTVNGGASNPRPFTVKPAPLISGVTPASGSGGTTVTLTGSNFGAPLSTSMVTLDGVKATQSAWSDTSITVAVPGAAATGPLVVIADGVASNEWPFTAPPLISFVTDPMTSGVSTMTITGANFGTVQGTSTVAFDGVPADVISWGSSIETRVPGPGPIVVTVKGIASNAKSFTLLHAPGIWSVSPAMAATGSVIAIQGANFGTTQGASTVTINGASASAPFWSDDRLSVTVPSGATSSGSIVVTVGGNAVSWPGWPEQFEVVPRPNISSVTPASATVGASITVSGTNLGSGASDARGGSTVTFNGTVATPVSWSPTSITVPVPPDATSGPLVVTLGADASNAEPFVVVGAPRIDSITPTSGPPGATVIVRGHRFGTSGTLTFNGQAATPVSWTDTLIQTTVPLPAETGPVVVTSGSASAPVLFTVTTTGAISGAVTRASDSSTVAGATVTARQGAVIRASDVTDGSGHYALAALAAGLYDVTVVASGLGTTTIAAVPLSGAGGLTLNVSLAPPGSITGTVTQAVGGSPIAGATVTAWRNSAVAATATATGSGTFALADLAPADYRLEARAPDFEPSSRSVLVTPGAPTNGDVALSAIGDSTIQFSYDDVGRLTGIVTGPGDSAGYGYDSRGNITSITRRAADALTVLSVSPSAAAIGATVLVSGSGFSSTPSLNTVTFNGTVATVTNASATQLTVVVPVAATTGPVAVTAPLGSGSAPGVFTIVTTAPTITGFSPSITPWSGETVTITGTNFTNLATTKVWFNGVPAPPTSVVATTIVVMVPGGATSGRLMVRTPAGQATSQQDFFVGEPSAFTGRATIGTPLAVVRGPNPGKVVFDGVAGQRIAVVLTFGTTNTCTAQLFAPGGTRLLAANCSGPGAGASTAATLPVTGGYTVQLPTGTSASGTLTVFDVPPDLSASVTPGGSAVPVATTVPGQGAHLTWTNTPLDRVGLWVSGNTYASCWVYLHRPSGGTTALSMTCPKPGGFIDVPTLTESGTYRLEIVPLAASTGGMTVTAVASTNQTIAIDGPPGTAATTVDGQSVLTRFNGTAGQTVFTRLTADSFFCGARDLVTPSGSVLATMTHIGACASSNNGYVDSVILPESGAYALVRRKSTPTGTGSTTVQAWTVTAATGSTTINGTPAVATTSVIGQVAEVTFPGTLGQAVTVRVTGNTAGSTKVSLIRPDGSVAVTSTSAAAAFNLTANQLTMTGTHRVVFDPAAIAVGSATIAVTIP